jgi:hypothetical protein
MRSESWHGRRVKPTAIHRWSRLDRSKRVLLIEATGAVCVASLAVKLLPFKKAIRLGSRETVPACSTNPADVLPDVRWAIDAATTNLPWNAVCIHRGLAAQWMLRRRGIDARLHSGLAKDDETALRAHVWVDALGETLVGGEEAADYIRVATFP